MSSLKFSLEQVLRYRMQLEEQAMQALAKARVSRDGMLRHIASLEEDAAHHAALLCQAADLTAAELWLYREHIHKVQMLLGLSYEELRLLEEAVEECRAVLVKKAQERELLEKLKEKQRVRHDRELKQSEQKTYDEMATLRFTAVSL